MKQAFKNLTSREKKLGIIAFVIIFSVIAWLLVYKPIIKKLEQKEIQLLNLINQYDEMRSKENEFSKINKNNNIDRDTNTPFIAWIDNQLETNGLSQFLTRSEPENNKKIIMTFEGIGFDEFISWAQNIVSVSNIKIEELDVTSIDTENGLVNIRTTLEEK